MVDIERDLYTLMEPTAELYEKTTDPLQRAMLRTWWRHVHLEGAAMLEEITAPDMMVENPQYRVGWGEAPAVVDGTQGVKDFYGAVGDIVLWHSDDSIAVADWGIADEITFHQVGTGRVLKGSGYQTPTGDDYYHVSSRQAFIWHFDADARLIGEHLYEDPTSLKIELIAAEDVITPARVREIHREHLQKLEERFGHRYWDYRYLRENSPVEASV